MSLLLLVAVVLIILWLAGAFLFSLGSFVHILLVVGVILLLWHVLSDRSST